MVDDKATPMIDSYYKRIKSSEVVNNTFLMQMSFLQNWI